MGNLQVKKVFSLGLIGLFFVAHVFLANKAIRDLSPTFDETVHLTSGYLILKTKTYFYQGLDHPPFAELWAGLPLLFMKPEIPTKNDLWERQDWRASTQYPFADEFIFHNTVSFERMMTWGRRMILLLSLFGGLLLTAVLYKRHGLLAALISAGFWSFSPTLLAHGSVVTTDMAFAVFFFAFAATLKENPSPLRVFLSGVLLGLAFASKYFGWIYLPCFGLLMLWSVVEKGWGQTFQKENVRNWFAICLLATLTIAVAYQFTGLSLFERGMRYAVRRSSAGQSSFLLGQHSDRGWWWYFPVVFLIKTETPLLIAFVLSLVILCRQKLKMNKALMVCPSVFFVLVCFSKKQIGHRYLLLLYPFVIYSVGTAVAYAGRRSRIIFGALLVWLAILTYQVSPNYLSYFNDFVGGSKNGVKWLSDSNLDWGQGLKQLEHVLTDEQKRDGVYMAYFGVVDPMAYHIPSVSVVPQGLGSFSVSKRPLHPTTFVLSKTISQTSYASIEFMAEIKKMVPAHELPSLYIYDLSARPDLLSALQKMSASVR